MKAQDRHPIVLMLLAANRTGKTRYIQNNLMKKNKYKRILIITDSKNPDWDKYKTINLQNEKLLKNFKGVRQAHFIEHEKESWQFIHTNFRDGLIIFDDAKDYIMPTLAQNGKYFKKTLTGFTHTLKSDLIFVFHSPDQASKRIYDHTDWLLIGNCGTIADHKMRLEKIDKIIQTQRQVNAEYQRRLKLNNGSHYGLFAPIRLK